MTISTTPDQVRGDVQPRNNDILSAPIQSAIMPSTGNDSPERLDAIRSILLDWSELSRGDISLIIATIKEPGAVVTNPGSPSANFWSNVVKLGWAETLPNPLKDSFPNDQTPVFKLTDGAAGPLAHFLVHYDLLFMGACTPQPPRRSLESFRRDAKSVGWWAAIKPEIPIIIVSSVFILTGVGAWISLLRGL